MLQLFSQETDLLMKVIMKCVNIKLWDILSCFHYILNTPRTLHFFIDSDFCHNYLHTLYMLSHL